MDIAELGLVVRSDGVVIAGKRLRDFKKDAADTDKAVGLLNGTFTKLASLAGVVAGSFLVKALVDYSSAWSDLSERVELATGSVGNGTEVMARLEAMARRTYSSLNTTADSYLRNANALKDLGLSTEEALNFTESLNNAMVVSGAKAAQAESVQNALAKAMGSGKLSGEDLNTILERGGRIAQLLAEELGTTTLGLRAMGAEGKITSDVIQRTLLGNLEKLRAEADSMAATMLDGFQLIGNSIFAFVGRVDQAVGAGENLAGVFVGIADAITASTEPAIAGINILIENVPRLTTYAAAFATVWGVQYVAAMLAGTTATGLLSAALGVLRTAMMRTGIGLLIVAAAELVYQIWNVVDGSSSLGEAFDRLKTSGMQTWERIGDGASWISNLLQGVALSIGAAFTKMWADVMNGFTGLMNAIKSGWNAAASVIGGPLIETSFENEVLKKYMDSITMKADAADALARADDAYNRMIANKSGMSDLGTMPGFDQLTTELGSRPGLDAPGVPPALGGGGGGAADQLNAYQQATKAIKEQTEALGWETEALSMSNMEADKFSQTMDLLRAAKEAGIPITESLINEVNGLATAYATASEESRNMERNMQMINQLNSAVASGFADVFTSILDGSKSAGEAIGDLLSQLGKLLINQAFGMLFNVGGGGGGLLGKLLSFDGGGDTPSGPRTGGVDGKGGFLSILHPDETVVDNTKGKPANDNKGGDLHITINGSGLSQAQLTQAIADAISRYDDGLARKVESKVRVMTTDPRAADGGWQ